MPYLRCRFMLIRRFFAIFILRLRNTCVLLRGLARLRHLLFTSFCLFAAVAAADAAFVAIFIDYACTLPFSPPADVFATFSPERCCYCYAAADTDAATAAIDDGHAVTAMLPRR